MKDVFVRKPNKEQETLLKSQPTWEHDPETWSTTYDERCETCMIIEGNGYVTLEDGSMYRFSVGDLVTFRPGLKCNWTVEKKMKKYYIFDIDL